MTQSRRAAQHIVRTLVEHGHVAYFAGGCVRDEVLGHEPSDYDVATDAPPDRIKELFPSGLGVGAAFGVMLVHSHKTVVEVATFREESHYSDKRRPDAVHFSTADRDAQRRDFTINALYLDPLAQPSDDLPDVQGKVFDYVDGIEDLRAGCVRAVGDPNERLDEDHLRALRAVRFTARLGFTLDADTARAIENHASELVGVSRERIGQEIKRMLEHESRAQAVSLLTELQLDAPVLCEPHTPKQGEHLDHLKGTSTYALALAAWALDRLGLGASDWDARQHEIDSLIDRWRQALCLRNIDRDSMRSIVETLRVFETTWRTLGQAQQKRLASSRWAQDALQLVQIRSDSLSESLKAEIDALANSFGGLCPVPLVNGQNLVDSGVPSGPGIGRVLEEVYNAQLEGRIASRSEAFSMAMGLLDAE